MSERISIVIPAYNHATYVPDLMESLLSINYENCELIIIDDGSIDQTFNILSSYRDRCEKKFVNVIFKSRENIGVAATLNEGIKLSSGEFIFLIASDDYVLNSEIFNILLPKLTPDTGLVFGESQFRNVSGKKISWQIGSKRYFKFVEYHIANKAHQGFPVIDPYCITYKDLISGNFIPTGILLRKQALVDSGFFIEGSKVEDWSMWLEISKKYKIKFVDEVVVAYRFHPQNTHKHIYADPSYAKELYRFLLRELKYASEANCLDEWLFIFQHVVDLKNKLLSEKINSVTSEINQIKNQALWKISSKLISAVNFFKISPYFINGLKRNILNLRSKILRDKSYDIWFRLSKLQTQIENKSAVYFENNPLVSILITTYNSNQIWLAQTIESVLNQSYKNWELLIYDDGSSDCQLINYLKELKSLDPRIEVHLGSENINIAGALQKALDLSSGQWVTILDHDDTLEEDALNCLVKAINDNSEVRLIYSDEDKISPTGRHIEPFFKPDWSPHLALAQAYLGHLICFDRSILDFRFNSICNGAQDYDFWLNIALKLNREEIVHIPKILYHWRQHEGSTAFNPDSKAYAHEAGRKAVEAYFKKKYPETLAEIVSGDYKFTYKVKFENSLKTASIIIPTKDKIDILSECVESILNLTDYQNYEIIIINNNSELEESSSYFELASKNPKIKIINADFEFNWSKINNLAVKHASGDVLVFLNNDTKVISPEWLNNLVGYAMLPDVGVVGGLLLYSDGSIQHAGVVVGMNGWADHVYKNTDPKHHIDLFSSPVLTRNALAVTGACMAISRDKFNRIGKFDEEFIICGSDVEICVRAYKAGYFNVMCAESKLYHYESKTRSPHVPANDFEQSIAKYAPFRVDQIDPFYNPNLSLFSTTPKLQFGIK